MKRRAAFMLAAVFTASMAASVVPASKPNDTTKATLTLRATPAAAFAPARIMLVGQVKGGRNDNADLYCPTIEWDWGDGTVSESSSDCDPFEPTKTEIQRSFTTQHVYKYGGDYVVQLRLKRQNRVVA